MHTIMAHLGQPISTSPKLDPFERFHRARGFDEWEENRSWLLGPVAAQVGKFVQTLRDYPPRMKSFDIDVDQVMHSLCANQSRWWKTSTRRAGHANVPRGSPFLS